MTPPVRPDSWLVAVLVGIQILGLANTARGEPRLGATTIELTLVGGYSFSHNVPWSPGLETVEGYHFIPHVSYFLTDERGSGWVRGNFALLVEPNLIRVAASDPATLWGVALLGRWVFAGWWTVRPYVDAGVGVLGGQLGIPQSNCATHFILEGGPGVLLFLSDATAITAGYRFHHISNANTCSSNVGINSSLFVIGLSYFFP